jgi:hypothetical protein
VSPTSPPTDRAAVARAVRSQRSAERAVDDPRQLARAARIVRAALARGVVTPADVIEGGDGNGETA